MKIFITFLINRMSIAALCLLCAGPGMAQCSTAPNLAFHSPVLISGTDGQVGAIYHFANVAPGLDARIEVTGIYGGATLFNIDDSAGIGYYNAFQPYVGAGAGDTSYIDWRIYFKKGGTEEDTTLPCLAVTGVDVDGDASQLKEFIEAATPGSISVDPATNLSVSFDGVRSKATSPVANIPLIDTMHREAMFQMNFTNITSLDYRNGAITTGGAQVRQTCIYFKPFFESYIMLPSSLLSFGATSANNTVAVKWTASNETNVQHYTLQRSTDGKSWANIGNIQVMSARLTNEYLVNDFSDFSGIIYYRLMEVMKNGASRYSQIVKVSPNETAAPAFVHGTMFTGSIRLQTMAAKNDDYQISLYTISGQAVFSQRFAIHAGTNVNVINVPSSARPGVYLLMVKTARGQDLYHAKLIKAN